MKCPKCHSENPDTKQFCADCGTRLFPPKGIEASVTKTLETTPDELARGTLFAGRYEIIEELGAGGMGRVYRAFDKKIEEEVALKLLKPEIAADRKTVDRFRNELKLARKIRHSNVCGMFDLGEEARTLFISMEYVRGEDLKSFLHRTKTLPPGTALSVARQVAEGLAEAHKLGITHRDLKPGNIMIDKNGNAKIMDFGIARSLAAAGTTAEGAIIGTPEYMSPEQVEGKPADARADIYALGIILFEMLTGRVPFEGDTPLSVAHKHRYESAPDPGTLNPQISGGLSRFILRCLEKEREKRYQSAEDLLVGLGAVDETLPAAERMAPRRKTITGREVTVKFQPVKLIIPAVAILVLAVAAAIFFLLRPKKDLFSPTINMPSLAILYFKNNTGDKNLDIWREGLCQSLIIKLSQSRHVRVLDQSQIYSLLKRLNLLEQDNFTTQDLKEIASRGMASHILRGSLSKAGDRFRTDLTLQNASTLEIIASESADGTGEESFFAMVDSLAERLKTGLGLTAPEAAGDVSKKIGDVTTTSVEAFKYYVQGQQFYNAGDFTQAISYFQKSVAIDPQFAMAYLGMGLAYWVQLPWKEMRLNLQKAFDLRDRVSARERMLIEAEYFQRTSEKTWDKAIDSYSKLIADYPWDLTANHELAFLYWMMDEWDEAIKLFDVVRRYKDESIVTYQMLAWCYLAKGQTENAKDVLEGYLNTFGDNAFLRANLGIVYCIEEKYEKAETEIEKAFAQTPESVSWFKYLFLLCIEDFASVEKIIQEMESSQPTFCIGFRSMSLELQGRIEEARTIYSAELMKWQDEIDPLELAQFYCSYSGLLEKSGDFSGALSACKTGLQKAQEAGNGGLECLVLYRRGVTLAEAGQFEEAEQAAEELLRTVESGLAKKRFRYLEALLGVLSLQKKDFISAQDHLEKALSMEPIDDGVWYNLRSELLYYLGQALTQTDRLEEAKKAYEDILSHRLRSLWGWDAGILVFAMSYYQLGIVLERRGDNAGAMKNYGKFLKLWKDADPGLPEVEDARKRLAAIS